MYDTPLSTITSSLVSWPSRTASHSSRPCTSCSSSSTIWGPGAVSGKVILALGKATLRGLEYAIVRRRLAAISAHFPHTDAAATRNLDAMYDDLLELIRPRLYSEVVREHALRVLLAQIARGHTLHFAYALLRWPLVETKIVLGSLLTSIDSLWQPGASDPHDRSLLAYRKALPTPTTHPAVPFMDFLTQLARTGVNGYHAVLAVPTLDTLLGIYACDFCGAAPALRESCMRLLRTCAADPAVRPKILAHPLRALWPQCAGLGLSAAVGPSRARERSAAWRAVPPERVEWRVRSVQALLREGQLSYDDDDCMADLLHDFVDLAGGVSVGADALEPMAMVWLGKVEVDRLYWEL